MTAHRRAVNRHTIWLNTILSFGFLLATHGSVCQLRAQPEAQEGGDGPAFLESVHCAICHANSSRATAMRDGKERGVAPFDLWRSSAMANSTRDPFWRAVLSAEVAATPSQKALIEEKCTRCHAPMAAPASQSPPGQILAHLKQDDQRAWLGVDGVSCSLCHQIRSDNLGTDSSFTGHFEIGKTGSSAKKGPIFGPHADPFPMPMQHHTGYTPTHSEHVLRAGLCATCHTLNTDAVNPDGTLTGHSLHEQSPYLEWRNSVYNDELKNAGQEAKSCQACHMPTTDQDGQVLRTRIAHNPGGRDFPFLQARAPFGRHTFYGGNVLLIRLLRDNYEQLDVQAPQKSLVARLEAAQDFLQHNTARVELGRIRHSEQHLEIPVTVTNLAGHKLPTAYPSRRVWLRVEVRDATGALVFASGQFDNQGRLIDRRRRILASEVAGGPLLPHFQQIDSSDQVQVYQSIMAQADGQATFTLLRGARYVKDNRLLPRGWKPEHVDARATTPAGTGHDADFTDGRDTVLYKVALESEGPHSVKVSLHYQVLSPRHADELFGFDTPEVKVFRQLYNNTELVPETLATARQTVQ